jgi:hypothetical protein
LKLRPPGYEPPRFRYTRSAVFRRNADAEPVSGRGRASRPNAVKNSSASSETSLLSLPRARPSLCKVAAVDRQDGAGDERGLVGREKGNRLSNLVRLTKPTHGMQPLDLLDVLVPARLVRQA